MHNRSGYRVWFALLEVLCKSGTVLNPDNSNFLQKLQLYHPLACPNLVTCYHESTLMSTGLSWQL